jgi:hypothetical protein
MPWPSEWVCNLQKSIYNPASIDFEPLVIEKIFISSGWPYFAAFVLVAAYFLWRGNYKQKVVLGLAPLALTVFVYNPLLAPYIARHITSYATFWRMLWLVPVGMGIAAALTEVIQRKTWLFGGLFILYLGFSLVNNSYLYSNLNPPENIEKLPNEQLKIAEFISHEYGDDAIVISPEIIAVTVREVETAPRFFWSRQDYIDEFTSDGKKNTEFNRRMTLQSIMDYNDDMPADKIISEMKVYQINVVVAAKYRTALLPKLASLPKVLETDNFIVYTIPYK